MAACGGKKKSNKIPENWNAKFDVADPLTWVTALQLLGASKVSIYCRVDIDGTYKQYSCRGASARDHVAQRSKHVGPNDKDYYNENESILLDLEKISSMKFYQREYKLVGELKAAHHFLGKSVEKGKKDEILWVCLDEKKKYIIFAAFKAGGGMLAKKSDGGFSPNAALDRGIKFIQALHDDDDYDV